MIEHHAFGSIQVDGLVYTTDILIYPDGRVTDHWWRRSGHRLTYGDLEPLLASRPDLIVIGTGVHGRMQPEQGLKEALQDQGIDWVMDVTGKAVHHFNRLSTIRKTGAGFHLTC